MATIPDITITSTEYTDINAAAGIAIGTAIDIVNKGSVWVYLQESETQPDADSTNGMPMAVLPWSTASVSIDAGGDTVWAKTTHRSSKVTVSKS